MSTIKDTDVKHFMDVVMAELREIKGAQLEVIELLTEALEVEEEDEDEEEDATVFEVVKDLAREAVHDATTKRKRRKR